MLRRRSGSSEFFQRAEELFRWFATVFYVQVHDSSELALAKRTTRQSAACLRGLVDTVAALPLKTVGAGRRGMRVVEETEKVRRRLAGNSLEQEKTSAEKLANEFPGSPKALRNRLREYNRAGSGRFTDKSESTQNFLSLQFFSLPC